MDESLSMVAIDISNRPYLVFNAKFDTQMIGSMSTQCFKEFFRAFVNESRVTLHINLLYGENDHHKIESIFKAFARALKEGSEIVSNEIASSKGFCRMNIIVDYGLGNIDSVSRVLEKLE